jgi:hypothetical protein
MIPALTHLITQARSLANDDPCITTGHVWETEGGRTCPKGWSYAGDGECCSQTVYVCRACGEYDYGDRGGLAYAECFEVCQRGEFE